MSPVLAFLRQIFAGRPLYMNALLLFCAYMTTVYLPFDLFWKPVAEDQEVWFGFMLTGWAAKTTEPLHWAIYAAGTWGFLKMRSWMHPWAALYVAQIAIGMLIWNLLDERSPGWWAGVISCAPFAALAAALWWHRALFASAREPAGG